MWCVIELLHRFQIEISILFEVATFLDAFVDTKAGEFGLGVASSQGLDELSSNVRWRDWKKRWVGVRWHVGGASW